MHSARSLLLSAGIIALGSQLVAAQAPAASRYRAYALGSTLRAVAAESSASVADATTLHERPARIQELRWRTPYFGGGTAPADPVREIVFTFYDDALYRIVVTYDRDRTEGLTNGDLIDSVSAEYGTPARASTTVPASTPDGAVLDGIVLARWGTTESTVTLVRGAYAAEFQLVVESTALSARARHAVAEAGRLDAIAAPRLEAERRAQVTSEADAARVKARARNKAAFRP